MGQRKIWVPDRNRTHDLPNTGRAFYPLSYENSWRARVRFLPGTQIFLCPMLVSCRLTHLSYILPSYHHLYSLINTENFFYFFLKLINYLRSSYPTRASYSGPVDGFRNPMKNELKTRPCLKLFQTRMQIFLICILIKQQKHKALNNLI